MHCVHELYKLALQKDLAPVLAELYAREKQGMALVEDLEMAEDALREAEKGYDVAYVEGRFEDAERHKQTIIEQEVCMWVLQLPQAHVSVSAFGVSMRYLLFRRSGPLIACTHFGTQARNVRAGAVN